jgi:hypothetical protein
MNEDIQYHAARVLLLLEAMGPRGAALNGLTKLVKLDFLLRYPQFLSRLLIRMQVPWPDGIEPTNAESLAVESPMIRYKYGPWDDRYYPILGYLRGTGLADVRRVKGTMSIRLTQDGRSLARQLATDPAWTRVWRRAQLLHAHFNVSGNALKERIYHELPDVVDRPQRQQI